MKEKPSVVLHLFCHGFYKRDLKGMRWNLLEECRANFCLINISTTLDLFMWLRLDSLFKIMLRESSPQTLTRLTSSNLQDSSSVGPSVRQQASIENCTAEHIFTKGSRSLRSWTCGLLPKRLEHPIIKSHQEPSGAPQEVLIHSTECILLSKAYVS